MLETVLKVFFAVYIFLNILGEIYLIAQAVYCRQRLTIIKVIFFTTLIICQCLTIFWLFTILHLEF